MKTLLKAATLAFAMISVPMANAADTQKIGVVFPSKIMKESPQMQRVVKKLDTEFKGRYEALQSLGAEIANIEKTLKRDAELMDSNELSKLKLTHEIKLSEYKLTGKSFQDDNRRRQGEEQQKAMRLVQQVISEVAKKQGYDIILNGEQIVFTAPEFDISDIIIEEISKK